MYSLVIADTSCLILLEKINRLHLLKDFFGDIYITEDVKIEYGEPLPAWIKIKKIESKITQRALELRLDQGEASAIALGLENTNSLLLLDEKKGRRIALELGLKLIGTLGIIIRAKESGKINSISKEIEKLQAVNYRISDSLVRKVIEKYDSAD